MKKTTILLADDHALFSNAWAFFLNQLPTYQVLAEVSTAEEAIATAQELKPDIILLDIALPGINGIEATKQLRKCSPATKIIGVSTHVLPVYAKAMIRAGAMAYVTKSSPQQELLMALNCVSEGKKYICEEVKLMLADQLGDEESENLILRLTGRELEIVGLLRSGASSKEIAEQLSLSTKTVDVHRYKILKKMGLKNTTSLIAYMNEQQIGLLSR